MTSSFDEIATRRHGDWRALMRARVNVLVTAPRDLFDAFALSCRGMFREPVACVRGGDGAALRLEAVQTLIIVDLHLLAPDDQRALATWMADPSNGRAQVIALTPDSVFSLVREGRFDRDLYYRLNTIHLDLMDRDVET